MPLITDVPNSKTARPRLCRRTACSSQQHQHQTVDFRMIGTFLTGGANTVIFAEPSPLLWRPYTMEGCCHNRLSNFSVPTSKFHWRNEQHRSEAEGGSYWTLNCAWNRPAFRVMSPLLPSPCTRVCGVVTPQGAWTTLLPQTMRDLHSSSVWGSGESEKRGIEVCLTKC